MKAVLPFVALTALLASPAYAHQGHNHSHRAAWDACEEEELGAECAYEGPRHATYRGSCRAMSGALVCVRNRPIEPAEAGGPESRAESQAKVIGQVGALLLPGALLGLALIGTRRRG